MVVGARLRWAVGQRGPYCGCASAATQGGAGGKRRQRGAVAPGRAGTSPKRLTLAPCIGGCPGRSAGPLASWRAVAPTLLGNSQSLSGLVPQERFQFPIYEVARTPALCDAIY
jgi:hypothetical protein